MVFFIYAMLSMAVHRGLQLDLPESSEAALSQEKKEPLFLSIGSGVNGMEITINEIPVALHEIPQQLLLAAQSNSAENAPAVLLFAEEKVSYQQLYTVLDELKKGGITDISLQASTE